MTLLISFFIFTLVTIIIIAFLQRKQYIHLGFRGVKTKSKHFINSAGNEIVLLGMVHLGDASFYEKVKNKHGHLLSLNEAVTDKNKLMAGAGSYKLIAKKIGITAQDKNLFPNSVHADVDFSELPANEINVLKKLFNVFHIFDDSYPEEQKKSLINEYKREPIKDRLSKEGILKLRNQRLIKNIETHETSKIIIPWGANHLPEIEDYLFNKGYSLNKVNSFQVINYFSLIKSLFIFVKTFIKYLN